MASVDRVAVGTVARWEGMGQYMRAKSSRGREQARERAGPMKSTIFNECKIWLTGRTGGPTDWSLLQMVTENGGEFEAFALTSTVTHIVTKNLASGNKQWRGLLARKGRSVKIVTPEWITSSVAAGVRLPEEDFKIEQDLVATTGLDRWLLGQTLPRSAPAPIAPADTICLLSDSENDSMAKPALDHELWPVVEIVSRNKPDPVRVALALQHYTTKDMEAVVRFLQASKRSHLAWVLRQAIKFTIPWSF